MSDDRVINNVQELGEWLGCDSHGEVWSVETWAAAIARTLYKYTASGMWFEPQPDTNSVRVGSIVEGVDYDTQTHDLTFPFTAQEFNDACDKVEEEAEAIWDGTHGCDKCPPSIDYPGYNRIDPECPHCKGEGDIF